jgi:cytochrome c oxidase subunit I+III
MVAVVPFDWQAHDSYFVVAHLHYVLIGGMVFPLFAAFYYWLPYTSRHALSERLGRWVFGLMFRLHVAFFQCIHRAAGMPRRYTYPAVMEWNVLNLISTAGVFLVPPVSVFLVDLPQPRPTLESAGDLEGRHAGAPDDAYGPRSVPIETWSASGPAGLAEDVEPGATIFRAPPPAGETIVTADRSRPISAVAAWLADSAAGGARHCGSFCCSPSRRARGASGGLLAMIVRPDVAE